MKKPSHKTLFWIFSSLFSIFLFPLQTAADEVGITADLSSVSVKHGDKTVVIERNQDTGALVDDNFARTSRPCPPFCIQPMQLAPGVETIGELELLDYLQKREDGDDTILLVDSRTPDWAERGTIPGAMNIPWTRLSTHKGASAFDIEDVVGGTFGCENVDESWQCDKAKTVIMFCNGMWCGQSPVNIKMLLKLGYPAEKIKWYRGGMQNWNNLGFNTVKPVKADK